MNKTHYTSLELSKKLKDGGCELESEYAYYLDERGKIIEILVPGVLTTRVAKYDLLWDVCVKYGGHFFGECGSEYYYKTMMPCILLNLRDGDCIMIEDYIWKHTLFNPKNRDESNKEI